jgi:hypothetical protein
VSLPKSSRLAVNEATFNNFVNKLSSPAAKLGKIIILVKLEALNFNGFSKPISSCATDIELDSSE